MTKSNDDDVAVVAIGNEVRVRLPLTHSTGKVRVKRRTYFANYGEPVASRSVSLSQDCYAEWQIGYDLPLKTKKVDNSTKTCLSSCPFKNYKRETKFAYELAEIIHHSLRFGLCDHDDLSDCISRIEAIDDKDTFEKNFFPSRTTPRKEVFNDMAFYAMSVSYPLFVHRFGKYEILSEITIREKQRAIGTQAMLYLCIPLASLSFSKPVFGRKLDKKETALWHIGEEEAQLALELFNVFGMLSPKHRFDVLQILKLLAK